MVVQGEAYIMPKLDDVEGGFVAEVMVKGAINTDSKCTWSCGKRAIWGSLAVTLLCAAHFTAPGLKCEFHGHRFAGARQKGSLEA